MNSLKRKWIIILYLSLVGILFATEVPIISPLPGIIGDIAWGDYDNDGDLDLVIAGEVSQQSNFITIIYRNDNGVFTDINAGLPEIRGSVAWGDYDNDGDLDLLISGFTGNNIISRIYRNDSGIFTDINAGLPGVAYCSVSWGDYDNDGDLDLVIAGYSLNGNITRIYQNDSGNFSDINAGFPGVTYCSVSWGDYDNDGDLDLVMAGSSSNGNITRIYRNDNGIFTDINAGFPGVTYCSVSWGDYDNDGDLDLIIGGEVSANIKITRIFRNDNGTFADMNSRLPGVRYFSASWGDYDNDGDLDLVIAGEGKYYIDNNITQIYRNDNGIFSNIESFADINAGLKDLTDPFVSWGDYDNDGDLDLVTTGYTNSTSGSRIYRNDNGLFTDINAGLPGIYWSSVEWGDYDNDGDLDLAIVGALSGGSVTRIYRNDSGIFTNINAGLTGIYKGSVSWGDYDNDGDLDLIIAGETGSGGITRIYSNNNGIFTDINAGLPGIVGKVSWGDYDNDGDLDLVMAGYSSGRITRIYRNDNGIFTDINADLIGVSNASVSWGDYDNDGDLDLVMAGYISANNYTARIYRNDNGLFTDINAGFQGVYDCIVTWGDYDNDGDLDLLMAGDTGNGCITHIYRNDNGIFTDIIARLRGIFYPSVSWGDYDNDGDLDLLIAGSVTNGITFTRIYRNNLNITNNSPSSPDNLSLTSNKLFWDKATDSETPQNGLLYNVEVLSNDQILFNSMSLADGKRKVVNFGNVQKNTFLSLENIPYKNEYLAKVQAIDTGYKGGNFSSITIQNPSTFIYPTYNSTWQVGSTKIIRWNSIGKAMVKIQLSINNGNSWAILNSTAFNINTQQYTLASVPNFPSPNCKLRIIDASNSSLVYFESDRFSIVDNPQQNLSVNLSYTKILKGDTLNITWESTGIDQINIDYYNINSNQWTLIASNINTSQGSYMWQVPDTSINRAYIRLSNVNNTVQTISTEFSVCDLSWTMSADKYRKEYSVPLTWSAENIDSYLLQYSNNNGQSWTNITTINHNFNGNSFVYSFPNYSSVNFLLKVSDASNPNVAKVKAIQLTELDLVNPNCSSRIPGGKETLITWNSNYVDQIKIEYSSDNQITWNAIAESVSASNSSYLWDVPTIISNQCYIRISEVGYGHIFTTNISPITIFSINIIKPIVNELVQTGNFYPIEYTSYGVNNLDIYLSTNNGGSWSLLNSEPNNASEGIYHWLVLEQPTYQAKIKLQDALNSNNYVISSNFIITNKSLNLLSPNGSEIIRQNTNHNITWSSMAIQNVKLEYSVNNGSTWNTIIASTPANTGSYTWNVPVFNYTQNYDQCLLRISDTSDLMIKRVSVNVFTILAPIPAIVNLSSPDNLAVHQALNPVLNWTLTQYAVNYQLIVATDPAFNNVIVDVDTLTNESYSLNNLSYSQRYYWKVRAYNPGGYSAWSDIFSFTVRNSLLYDLPQQILMNEDTTLNLNLRQYTNALLNDQLVFTVSPDAFLNPIINGGQLSITPTANYYGQRWIKTQLNTLIRNDNVTLRDSILVIVNNVNDAPQIQLGTTYQTLEDQVLTIDLSTTISDIDQPLNELILSSNESEHINVSIQGHIVTFTPFVNWSGSEMITFTISDGVDRVISENQLERQSGITTAIRDENEIQFVRQNSVNNFPTSRRDSNNRATDSDFLIIEVLPMNDPPHVVQTITPVTFDEDTIFNTLNLNTIFSDVDLAYGDHLTYTVSQHDGINTTISNGQVTITPNPNWYGIHTLTFTATDDSLASVSTDVVLTVNNVNDAPALALPQIFSFDEDTQLQVDFTPFISDIDTPMNQLSLSSQNTEHLNVQVQGFMMTIIPTLNWYGSENLTFSLSDQGTVVLTNASQDQRKRLNSIINRETVNASVLITVNPVNDAPYIVQTITPITFDEDTIFNTLNLNTIFSDVDSNNLIYTVSQHEGINTTINNSQVTITPNPNWYGMHTLTFTATDDNLATISTDVVLTVNNVNDAPAIAMGNLYVSEDNPLVLDVSPFISDIDNSQSELIISGNSSAHVNVSIQNHIITFTPLNNWSGMETLTFTVDDGVLRKGNSRHNNSQTIEFTVYPMNDAPHIVQTITSITFDEDTIYNTLNLNAIFSDVDLAYGDYLTYSVSQHEGINTTISNGQVTITPNPNWYGIHTLSFTATDDSSAFVSTDVVVTVSPVNDAPVLVLPQIFSFDEDTQLQVDFTPFISDIDTPMNQLSLSSQNTEHLNVQVQGFMVTIVPALNWNGSENLTFSLSDQGTVVFTNASQDQRKRLKSTISRETVNASVLITVNPINDAPILVLPDSSSFNEDTPFNFDVSPYISDVDNQNFVITTNQSSHFNYIVQNHTINIVPSNNWFGQEYLFVTVNDMQTRASVTDSMLIIVNSINDIPVIQSVTPDSVSIHVYTHILQTFTVIASDVESPVLQYTWSINNAIVGSDSTAFTHLFDTEGDYTVKVLISDGEDTCERSWIVYARPLSNTPSLIFKNELSQNYPNPFNPTTMIRFSLKKETRVQLNIYNAKGQLVRILTENDYPAGIHTVKWDGKDDHGSQVSSGVYLYRIESSEFNMTRKMLMMK